MAARERYFSIAGFKVYVRYTARTRVTIGFRARDRLVLLTVPPNIPDWKIVEIVEEIAPDLRARFPAPDPSGPGAAGPETVPPASSGQGDPGAGAGLPAQTRTEKTPSSGLRRGRGQEPPEDLLVDGITVRMVRKDIRGLRLRVRQDCSVELSAPLYVSREEIMHFLLARTGWIRESIERQKKRGDRPPGYADGERHMLWGERHLLRVREGSPQVTFENGVILLTAPPGSTAEVRGALLHDWYARQIQAELPALLARWQAVFGVRLRSCTCRRMISRWGRCTPAEKSVRLSTELARLPRRFLEYILVHELCHFFVPGHDGRFYELLSRHVPDWRKLSDELAESPTW